LRAIFSNHIPGATKEIKVSPGKIAEGFVSALEIADAEGKDAERLIKRAKSALEGVNVGNKELKNPIIKALLSEVKKKVEILIESSNK
jgi:hypothetical protein